jgi:hypothetical protein
VGMLEHEMRVIDAVRPQCGHTGGQ